MHSFLQDIDSWDHSLPRWPDPNYIPLLPTHKIARKQTRRPRPPLSDIQNLPKCPFPEDLSNLSQFKFKMRRLQQQSDRWEQPISAEPFQKHARSGFIKAHTQSQSYEMVPQQKKRPSSCRQVSCSLKSKPNQLEQSFSWLRQKTPSIHSRHRSKSHSQHKYKAAMTINQLEQGKVQHILRCLNKLK